VSILDQDDTAPQSPLEDDEQFEVTFFSGTGPGGQNRNKVQASARILHVPSGLVRSAQTRSRKNSVALAMAALKEDLAKLETGQRHAQENGMRRRQVGSGMRGDKRRTYRFQEGLVHDHETGKTVDLRRLMAGDFKGLWPAASKNA
jgi:peptide chain release factor 1